MQQRHLYQGCCFKKTLEQQIKIGNRFARRKVIHSEYIFYFEFTLIVKVN